MERRGDDLCHDGRTDGDALAGWHGACRGRQHGIERAKPRDRERGAICCLHASRRVASASNPRWNRDGADRGRQYRGCARTAWRISRPTATHNASLIIHGDRPRSPVIISRTWQLCTDMCRMCPQHCVCTGRRAEWREQRQHRNAGRMRLHPPDDRRNRRAVPLPSRRRPRRSVPRRVARDPTRGWRCIPASAAI